MSLTNQQYQKLMKFMDCDMTQDEMIEFEKELESSLELKEQLQFEQALRDSVTNNTSIIKLSSYKNKFPYLRFASAAALLIAMFTVGYFISLKKDSKTIVKQNDSLPILNNDTLNYKITQNKKKEVNTDSLFTAYYKKEPSPSTYPLLLAEAFENYEKNNYATLERLDVENLPLLRGTDNEKEITLLLIYFYKGIVALEKKEFDRAITSFKHSLTYTKDEKWKDKINWYLGLVYLKEKDFKNSIQKIKSLKESSAYKTKAVNLVNSLTH